MVQRVVKVHRYENIAILHYLKLYLPAYHDQCFTSIIESRISGTLNLQTNDQIYLTENLKKNDCQDN